jgi:hypothetical protein
LLCSDLDECVGFAHDTVKNTCQFYKKPFNGRSGLTKNVMRNNELIKCDAANVKDILYPISPDSMIDLYIKDRRTVKTEKELKNFVTKGMTQIDSAINQFYERTDAKNLRNTKIHESINATDYHIRHAEAIDRGTNYARNNMILNSEFKEIPTRNFTTCREIDNAVFQLHGDLKTIVGDDQLLTSAYELLVSLQNDIGPETFVEYSATISTAAQTSMRIAQQIEYLLPRLREYSKMIKIRATLNTILGDLERSINDMNETHKELRKYNYDMNTAAVNLHIPQVVQSRYDRLTDSYEFIQSTKNKYLTTQTQASKLDISKLPEYDVQQIEQLNEQIKKIYVYSEKLVPTQNISDLKIYQTKCDNLESPYIDDTNNFAIDYQIKPCQTGPSNPRRPDVLQYAIFN